MENLQEYQARMKRLYGLEKFAFVDTDGLIYTSRGTRNDIGIYNFDYKNLTETEIFIKNIIKCWSTWTDKFIEGWIHYHTGKI